MKGLSGGVAGLVVAASLSAAGPGVALASGPRRAPEFPTKDAARWIGEPQRLSSLRGRVVLLDVWTFG